MTELLIIELLKFREIIVIKLIFWKLKNPSVSIIVDSIFIVSSNTILLENWIDWNYENNNEFWNLACIKIFLKLKINLLSNILWIMLELINVQFNNVRFSIAIFITSLRFRP